jgi:RNA polymerase sigma factor (sigma-70 family)
MITAVLPGILDDGNELSWNSPANTGWHRRASAVTAEPVDEEAVLDDRAWVARVRGGDETAARDLVQRLYPTIIKSVRRHLPRRTSEEDLVQAVYAKVFCKLGQYSGLVPLEHWVARVTINTCLSQVHHETVRPELRMSDLTEEEEAVVQHLAASDEDLPWNSRSSSRDLLSKLLDQLKPDEKLVITLLHLEERSTKEISHLTGWSISRVKVKAFRARRKLRKLWHRMLDSQPD